MKVNYMAAVAAASMLSIGVLAGCGGAADPCAADPCAAPTEEVAPCAAPAEDPCAAPAEDPCAAPEDPCAAPADPCAG
ncbi:hypothetical protein N836_04535 [Leptolyngbya sp. Heron Island J]|uniref:hypothetical protein n=1 Tax=Leptolyngbya sp. Heron Island J TaxID=1385935 RepID=UPI0003B9DA97|nr:hypothetical protein [Leptolyngbya sp. Heron Island J]ESA37081.1 hypothetical protein N836_04535 [Leptolyngbya sp. Heron Island J]